MDFEKLLGYDLWANQRVFEAFQSLETGEAKGNIERLFSHILAAQAVWVGRIAGENTKMEIWPELSLPEMKSLLVENNKKLKSLLSEKDETITYHNSGGEAFENKVEDILVHLTIHGQHHRAQIARLLREAGVKPPGTDYIFFLRTVHN